MSESHYLGPSIRNAVRFIEGIHKDVTAMIGTLEEIMAERGWHPTEKNRISSDMSNALAADGWLMKSVYRLYVPHRRANETQQLAAVQVEFNPPDAYDEPVCLLVAAKFPTATSYADIWNRWSHAGSERILRELAEQGGGFHPLSQQSLQDRFLPDAGAATAATVLLCKLTGRQALETLVVTPLLQAAAKC